MLKFKNLHCPSRASRVCVCVCIESEKNKTEILHSNEDERHITKLKRQHSGK